MFPLTHVISGDMFLQKCFQSTIVIHVNLIKFYFKCNSFPCSFRCSSALELDGALLAGRLLKKGDTLHIKKKIGAATTLPAIPPVSLI